jgi:nitroreductase
MNPTLATIAARYSCRAYDARPPERDKLLAVAQAALCAPSGMNRQPWRIVVVTDKGFIEEMDTEGMRIISQWEDKAAYNRFMARGGSLFYDAPVMLVVAKLPGTDADTGIVCQTIALAAHSVGLASVICGMAGVVLGGEKGEKNTFIQRLDLPEGYEFGMAVLVGYAKEGGGKPHVPDEGKISWV